MNYSIDFRKSAGDLGESIANGMSSTVKAPHFPCSKCRRYMARAKAVSTLEVNCGLLSSFRENSITWPVVSSVFPLRNTKPPWGMPLWFFANSSSEIKCTVVS